MAEGHKQTSDRVEFCRIPNCKQTDYSDVRNAVTWKSEAHHILCVAQVNSVIVKEGEKKGFKKVIDESKWCINEGPNMVALPLWGTTVMHYCNKFASIAKGDVSGLLKGIATLVSSDPTEPAFKNLPQHNYGHSGKTTESSYNKEIETKLDDLLTDVQVQMEEHAVTGDDIHGALNGLAGDMRTVLSDRGLRTGSTTGVVGTHAAWLNPGDEWYIPFSMAQTPKPLPFAKMTMKIKRLAEAFWSA
jgi:hypothetical protein